MLAAWRRRRLLAAAALSLAAAAAFMALPAYSAFDSIYSLVWGQEILHGRLPSFDAYRAPTEHPLWVALCAVVAPLGDAGNRALVAVCVAGFVALICGFFRLAEAIFGEPAAWIAALLLLSRLDYPFLAMRGYVDVPYLALIVWAAALEAERPRRGGAVWALLAAAGLLRPEAWVLSACYGAWMCLGGRRLPRIGELAWVAAAPALWMGTDLVVTGDPLYSLHYTTRSALALGRRAGLDELPGRLARYMNDLVKPPVLAAGVAGAAAAWRLIRPRARLALPVFLLAFGVLTFVGLSLRGFAVINRYLVVSALGLTLFAAFALTGWTRLAPGGRRRLWAAAAIGLALVGAGWTVSRFSVYHVRWEIQSRQRVHADMVRLLNRPEVRAARRCGPMTVPNHKLVPDIRYLLDAGEDGVLPRTTLPDHGRFRRGPALFVVGGNEFLKHPAYGPFDQLDDSPLVQVPGPDFRRVASGRYLAVYVNCPATARPPR